METIYGKVSVKERLPKEAKYYYTNIGIVQRHIGDSDGWIDTHGQTITHWLEEIPLPEIIQEKEREIKSLTANKNILERINQQNGELLAEIAKESNEKEIQIQELKEDVMGFAQWLHSNRDRVYKSLEGQWTTAGAYFTTEQLYSKYKDSKKQ